MAATVLFSVAGLLAVAASAYAWAHRDRLFPYQDTIVVYGTEGCSITRAVRADLAARQVPYVFADADVPAISDELWAKLGAGDAPEWITFPVVHVGGRVLLTPTADEILAVRDAYLAALENASSERDYATFLRGGTLVPAGH